MASPPDESAVICPLCSKQIRAGMGTARVGPVVAHLRCLARKNGLRALELEAQAAELISTAQRTMVEITRSEAERPFALAGRSTAFEAATRRMRGGVVELVVDWDISLEGLSVGVSVAVSCCRVRDTVFATEVRRLRRTYR